MRSLALAVCACAGSITALHGARQQDVSSARDAAAALPRLHSLVVSQRGKVVLEYHAKGHGPDRLANIKSASKSVIAALTGIAIVRKLIPDVDEPIVRWFPELRADSDKRK